MWTRINIVRRRDGDRQVTFLAYEGTRLRPGETASFLYEAYVPYPWEPNFLLPEQGV